MSPVFLTELGTQLHRMNDPGVAATLDRSNPEIYAVAIGPHEESHTPADRIRPNVMLQDVPDPGLADAVLGRCPREANRHLRILAIMSRINTQFKRKGPC